VWISANAKSIYSDRIMIHMQKSPQQTNPRAKKISEILAIAGMGALIIRVLDVIAGQGSQGFVPLSLQVSGIVFGISIIILFLLSFGFGFRVKTKITTSFLVSGGMLFSGFLLLAPKIGLLLYLALALQPIYFTFIIIGFVVMGLGTLRIIRRM
jgi:hypothetical protein